QRPDKALGPWNKALELDPQFKRIYNEIAFAYSEVGDYEQSILAIDKYTQLAPDEPNPYDSRGWLYAAGGRLEEGILSFRKSLAIKPDFHPSFKGLGNLLMFSGNYDEAEKLHLELSSYPIDYIRSLGRGRLGVSLMFQGRFEEALSTLNSGIAADKMENFAGLERVWKSIFKSCIFEELGQWDSAIYEVELAKDIYSRMPTNVPFANHHYLVQLIAQSGNLEKASEEADRLGRTDNARTAHRTSMYWYTVGYIEFLKGNYEASISVLRKTSVYGVHRSGFIRFQSQLMLSRALMQAGRLGEAVTRFEELLTIYSDPRVYWPILSVKLHYWTGIAYEKSGWIDKAIEQYETFLDIWKNADPGIESVDDAKMRLARLKSKL
ncbi:MAG: tetratricopeptide repeat protein, partial [Candidatus Zixiibacteriota bacterium]